eukprot:Clim_evm12s242 gene=Clim_evmTU12s242
MEGLTEGTQWFVSVPASVDIDDLDGMAIDPTSNENTVTITDRRGRDVTYQIVADQPGAVAGMSLVEIEKSGKPAKVTLTAVDGALKLQRIHTSAAQFTTHSLHSKAEEERLKKHCSGCDDYRVFVPHGASPSK